VTQLVRVSERCVGDVTILELVGRLVLEEGDTALRDQVDALVKRGRVQLLFDMAGVTRLDSAGIGMLAAKHLTARRAGGALKLLHPSHRARHLLQITRLDTASSRSSKRRTRRFAASVTTGALTYSVPPCAGNGS
jgi:anti-anti-sigma factor